MVHFLFSIGTGTGFGSFQSYIRHSNVNFESVSFTGRKMWNFNTFLSLILLSAVFPGSFAATLYGGKEDGHATAGQQLVVFLLDGSVTIQILLADCSIDHSFWAQIPLGLCRHLQRGFTWLRPLPQ